MTTLPQTPKGLQRVEHYLKTIVTGSAEQKITSLTALRNLAIQPPKRRDLVSFNGFIDVICNTLLEHVEESEEITALCVEIIRHLILEHPVVDHHFVMEPSCLTGLAKTLLETSSEDVQLNALTAIDHLSILEMHQTAVCGEDGLVSSVCEFLVHESSEIRDHALKTIEYLTSNPKNRFIIARTEPLLSMVTECLQFSDMQIPILCILNNLAQCSDNVPVLARDDQLVMNLVQLLNSGDPYIVEQSKKFLIVLSAEESPFGDDSELNMVEGRDLSEFVRSL
ncbi:hypothetical protein GEMRC1_007289 [Eukaryota sp. GEM-RC1]